MNALLWTEWRWVLDPHHEGTFIVTATDGPGWLRIRHHRSLCVEPGWYVGERLLRYARRLVATQEDVVLLALQGVRAEVGKPDPDVLAAAHGVAL